MDVFQYSANVQASFNASFPDYNVITTFAGDFAIADYYSQESVKETATTVWDFWKDNYKWATEIVMVLNFMCWLHNDKGNIELSRLYGELYYEYRDKFYKQFEGNEEANDYFFRMTD